MFQFFFASKRWKKDKFFHFKPSRKKYRPWTIKFLHPLIIIFSTQNRKKHFLLNLIKISIFLMKYGMKSSKEKRIFEWFSSHYYQMIKSWVQESQEFFRREEIQGFCDYHDKFVLFLWKNIDFIFCLHFSSHIITKLFVLGYSQHTHLLIKYIVCREKWKNRIFLLRTHVVWVSECRDCDKCSINCKLLISFILISHFIHKVIEK